MKRPLNPMARFVLPKAPSSGAGNKGAAVAAQFAHHAPSRDMGITHGLAMRLRRPKGGKGPHNPGE